MNIDLLPFSAFALESYGAPTPSRGELRTLTLELALAPVRSSHEAMSGSVSANQIFTAAAPLRAFVRPADGAALTITF